MSFVDKLLPKDKPIEYFLSLKIGLSTILATIWEIKGTKINIVGKGYSNIDNDQDYTESADKAISEAEKTLPPGKLVEKVIFGLPFEFTENNKIKPALLLYLKKLTHKLSLTPLGFIELPQAIAHFFSSHDNSPSTALLLGISKETLTASLLRVGKIFENVTVPRGENFIKDVEKVFKSVPGVEVLPSRILLYDDEENLEDLKEALIKHPWHKSGAFLHFPKIEIIPRDDIIHALVESAAAEIINTASTEELKHDKEHEDIALPVPPAISPSGKEENLGDENSDEAEMMGFHKNKDVLEEETVSAGEEDEAQQAQFFDEEEISTKKEKALPKISMPKLPKFRMPDFGRFKLLPVVIILVVLVILVGTGVYAYYQIPTATVRILVGSENMKKDIDITFSPKVTTVDSDTMTIPATKVGTDVSGDKSRETTGKKDVGTAAHGTVTIYNKTTDSKTLPIGAVLIANGLKFTLDSSSTIASASDTGEGLTYGKTDAKITASAIGPNSNLPGGTNFSLADFATSSFTAKNSDPLTGGTSRNVSVVSADDQYSLLTDLSNELKDKAKTALYQQTGSDQKLLAESMSIAISNKKFDKDINSEATQFSLTLSAHIDALSYKVSDFDTLATGVMANNIPVGFTFSQQNTNLKVNDISAQKDGSIVAKSTISASLLPKLPLSIIQKNLAGKSLADAQNYIKTQDNVMGVEIDIKNPFPFAKKQLPLKAQNIRLSIASAL